MKTLLISNKNANIHRCKNRLLKHRPFLNPRSSYSTYKKQKNKSSPSLQWCACISSWRNLAEAWASRTDILTDWRVLAILDPIPWHRTIPKHSNISWFFTIFSCFSCTARFLCLLHLWPSSSVLCWVLQTTVGSLSRSTFLWSEVERWLAHAFACFCYLSSSQHPCRFEITGTPNPARDEIMRHFSLPRRATSATSGMHDKFHSCLQQRCANCITQDLLRPRRSYFWKWSQGQHKFHHGCVWTTKMGKEKTTITEHEKHWAAGIFPLQYKWPAHWTSPCKGRFSNCTSSA